MDEGDFSKWWLILNAYISLPAASGDDLMTMSMEKTMTEQKWLFS